MKEAISSIHFGPGKLLSTKHNDRTQKTINSIFNDEKNECSCSGNEAIKKYYAFLKLRIESYTNETGKKLCKNTITHFSAIVNTKKTTTMKDLYKLSFYLKKELGTAVFQIAIHKDEGHVKDGVNIKNYHAHIEMMGIDEKGFSIRRKLTRGMLSKIQDNTAKILNMQRGNNYAEEKKKRPKRLGTYEYKEYKRREEITVQALKQEHRVELDNLKSKLSKSTEDNQSFKKSFRDIVQELSIHIKKDRSYTHYDVKDLILEKFLELKSKILNLKEENKKYAEYTKKINNAYKNLKQSYSVLKSSLDTAEQQLSSYSNQVISQQNEIEILRSQNEDLEEPDSFHRPSM